MTDKSRTKRKKSASLPSIKCHPEMRESMIKIAEEEGKSLGEVTREAIGFFLDRRATNSYAHDSLSLS